MTIFDLTDLELSFLATATAYSVSNTLTKNELLTLISFISTLNSNLSLILAKDVRFNSTTSSSAEADATTSSDTSR
ncbi:MAG: hypothetical protein SO136_03965 [Sarcina ventriculi]|uniref:Uncharacterized protein n=1 Tax=Sarcina ventriculi TaxID=1267 RepID=A0ABP2AVA9_SARVE|nr:hypothetical protein [Sarcina ventriculi]MDO4402896.1 hypothetical protein [Clostridiaceae bacterium]MBU5322912.1 hypothetical protein [Sarcina ventriculi]MCI5635634.1 hypothetical protein [Sarcina ventriculi]MDD7373685.1 hypothetical protein [Sarcina ventriculi]MDY7062056.1 hypothetical protein [Sarcina ventriculi]